MHRPRKPGWREFLEALLLVALVLFQGGQRFLESFLLRLKRGQLPFGLLYRLAQLVELGFGLSAGGFYFVEPRGRLGHLGPHILQVAGLLLQFPRISFQFSQAGVSVARTCSDLVADCFSRLWMSKVCLVRAASASCVNF